MVSKKGEIIKSVFSYKKKEELEKDISAVICEYLSYKHYFFWRQNVAPAVFRKPDGSMAFRKMGKYAKKGVPDIILFRKDGRVAFLEVKRPTQKQSDDQIQFQKDCKDNNADYYVVTSLAEVQAIGL